MTTPSDVIDRHVAAYTRHDIQTAACSKIVRLGCHRGTEVARRPSCQVPVFFARKTAWSGATWLSATSLSCAPQEYA